ncbi:MAG: carboxypeptidase regulatory-like domain-containing protein [Candidatus Sulfopaludibacter sp.]|nr:carboxypeptidase regulatory-like domain-containing protein [Candidatus Sulfopaludibacter sp.]
MWRAVMAAWSFASAVLAAQSVEGRVVIATTGAAIPAASVIIRPVAEHPEGLHRATSDAEGRFRIDGLEPGTYGIFYQAEGYWTDPAQQDRKFQVAAGGDAVRLDLKLLPLPKIAGSVTDALGNPVPNATVWVLGDKSRCNGLPCYPILKEVKASEKGEYEISDVDAPLPAWLVSAAAPASFDPPKSSAGQPLGWVQTFYPDATDPQLAARIPADPGSQHWNLDIRLATAPVHRIRGKLVDPGGRPVPNAQVAIYNALGPDLQRTSGSDGTFEFGPVADGEWRLWAKLDRGGVKLWTGQSVELKDRDLEGVEVRLTEPLALQGRIVFERPEGAPLPDDLPNVFFTYNAGRFGGETSIPQRPIGHPEENGAFTIQLYAGPYRVDILDSPAGPYYLDSARLGEVDVLRNDSVPILPGAPTLTVNYRYGGGSVQGTVEGCAGGGIALIPVDRALRGPALVRTTQCGPNGQFTFASVRPGEYYGIVITGQGPLDDSALRRASRVTVRNNEHTTAEISPMH